MNHKRKTSHSPIFFSTPHSFLPSRLVFLELCSNTRNQNGGISLMRAETQSLWSSLGGWSAPDMVLGWSLDEKQVTDGELSCVLSLMLPISKVPSTNLGIKPGGGRNSCGARQLQLGAYWAFNFPHMCTQVQGCSRWAVSKLGYWSQERIAGTLDKWRWPGQQVLLQGEGLKPREKAFTQLFPEVPGGEQTGQR